MNFGSRALAVFVLLGCAGTAAAALTQAPVPTDHPRAHPARKVKPKRVAAKSAPLVAPLHVSYEDGLLSISAQDASLSDILAQLHQRTGATIDAPADMDDRIVVELGPGPAVQVVAALLEHTQYNFVIAAAAKDHRAVQSIQLTRKPSLLEDLAPPVPGANDEEGAAAAQAGAKANPAGSDEGVWDDVVVPAATPAPPADTAVRPPK
jgi:hypothetical protein